MYLQSYFRFFKIRLWWTCNKIRRNICKNSRISCRCLSSSYCGLITPLLSGSEKNKEEQTTINLKGTTVNTWGWPYLSSCYFDVARHQALPLPFKYVCTIDDIWNMRANICIQILAFLEISAWLCDIKHMHFSFVNCMHLFSIIVYWYAINTTWAQ